jgi:hypothetical protein
MAELKGKKIQVSVAIRNKTHERRHTFDTMRSKLPVSYRVEGLRVTVEEAGKKKKPSKKKKSTHNPEHRVPRGSMRLTEIEVELPPARDADMPTWQKYSVLRIPTELRAFFPKYKEDFVLQTPRGRFIVNMASAHDNQTDPYRGQYLSKMTEFYRAHSDLAVGDVLVFTKDGTVNIGGNTYKRYKMHVKTS